MKQRRSTRQRERRQRRGNSLVLGDLQLHELDRLGLSPSTEEENEARLHLWRACEGGGCVWR
jgi:hypothetical protein